MLSAASDWLRIFSAGLRLARRDAFLPLEFQKHYPPAVRPLASLLRLGARRRDDAGRLLRPGERLALAFETMSPAYVKLGQLMATRPDIIGFEMAGDLGRLQDRMPAFPQSAAIAEIERGFGRPIGDLFPSFSEPIAAASIAQVHKAQTKDGRTVAVKILRPGIEETATREFRAFGRAARVLEAVSKPARRMEPVKFIATLKAAAAIELDLRMEAGAASALREALKSFHNVVVPDVVWPLSTKRVLTTEWIDGVSVADTAALAARGVDRARIAREIIQLFLTQALENGFFHADMHQGNILIDKAGRIVLVDFGIMGRLDDKTRLVFAEIIHGFITRNYRRTAEAHFEAGYVSREHSVDMFAQALRAVGEPLFGRSADLVDMSRVLQQLFDVTALFNMHLRPELVLLQRTMVTVEGVARSLHPSINMWETAAPVVGRVVAEAVGPRRQISRLREATLKALDIAPQLPRYVEEIAAASARVSGAEAGAPYGASDAMMKDLARERRLFRVALWFAGAAALILAMVTALR